MHVNFIESNPIPVKFALAEMGLVKAQYRLPLLAPTESSQKKIIAVLAELGLNNYDPNILNRSAL